MSLGQVLSFSSVVSNGSKLIVMDGVTLDNTQPNGTTYYFNGNSICMTLSHAIHSLKAPSLEIIFRSDNNDGKFLTRLN